MLWSENMLDTDNITRHSVIQSFSFGVEYYTWADASMLAELTKALLGWYYLGGQVPYSVSCKHGN